MPYLLDILWLGAKERRALDNGLRSVGDVDDRHVEGVGSG